MNTPNTTVLQLVITGFVDSREVVNRLNEFYAGVGVTVTQKAKYEKPTWFYILAVLGRRPLTIQQIVDKLAEYNLVVSYQSVRRFLKVMMNTDYAIHPHRRNCGISCHEIVGLFGGVHMNGCAVRNDIGAPADTYYLDCSSPRIAYLKRAHKIEVNPE